MRYVKLFHIVGFWLLLVILIVFINFTIDRRRWDTEVAELEAIGCRVSIRMSKQRIHHNVTVFADVSARRPSLIEAIRRMHKIGILRKLTIEDCNLDGEVLRELLGFPEFPETIALFDCNFSKDDLVRLKAKAPGRFFWSNLPEQQQIIHDVYGYSVAGLAD